jgi:hypothetical protein
MKADLLVLIKSELVDLTIEFVSFIRSLVILGLENSSLAPIQDRE